MTDPTGAKPGSKPGSTSPTKDQSTEGAKAKGSTKAEGGKMSSVKKWAITVLVALVAVVAAFGVGYLQGASGMEELEQQAESATRQARLLEARRRLDLTHLELENRNFGHAEAHLRAAAQKLTAFAEDDGRLGQLARDVAQTQIGNTDDMATQKQKIRAFIHRFDEINRPGSGASATTANE